MKFYEVSYDDQTRRWFRTKAEAQKYVMKLCKDYGPQVLRGQVLYKHTAKNSEELCGLLNNICAV